MNGFLLVGGQSRRFGAPKQAAEVHGQTFAEWGVCHLQEALGPQAAIWLVAPQGQAVPQDLAGVGGRLRRLNDTSTGAQGPLGGVASACRQGGGLVLAVDLPALSGRVLRRLTREKGPRPVAFAVEGRVQPLAAYWPPEAFATCQTVLWGSGRVMEAFERAGGQVLDYTIEDPLGHDAWRFMNVNTRADLATLEQRWRDT